jgi:uncharacterized lipoprotein YmbA
LSGNFSRCGLGGGLAIAILALSACMPAPPPPALYVLGNAAPEKSTFASQLHAPAIEVKYIRIPDYLDTTDIIARGRDGRVIAVLDARWAERLSDGMTRAIGASLETRLPQFAVTTSPPLDVPRWQVLIDVDTFEQQPDDLCVLAGRCSIWDGNGERKLRADRFSVMAQGNADAKVLAAAMTSEINQLAGEVVAAFSYTASSE